MAEISVRQLGIRDQDVDDHPRLGLFEQVADEVAQRYPEVPHSVELFDALLAKVIISPDNYRVVLVLNEYGDFLSDLASGLVGSLGTGASGNFSFDDANQVEIAMFDIVLPVAG